MFEERTFEVDGRRINAVCGPEHGPPLVMLHGVTRRWQTFLPLLSGLAANWTVVAPDFPGHGRSDRGGGRYRVVDYVPAAVSFVERHVRDSAVIYGHSLGAMVAAAAAARLGPQARAAVLEDPPFETMGRRIGQTPLQSFFAGMQRLAGSSRPVREVAADVADIELRDPQSGGSTRLGEMRDAVSVRFTAQCLKRLDPPVLDSVVAGQWLEGYDRRAVLRDVRCPVLLMQADTGAGGMLTDEDARAVTDCVADGTHVRFPGVDHVIHWSRTTKLLNLVTAFLSSLDEPDRHELPPRE